MADDSFSGDEILPEARIYTSRAKDYRETCAEEIRKMFSKIEDKASKVRKPVRKSKRRAVKKLRSDPVLEENDEFEECEAITPEVKLEPAVRKRLQKLEDERIREIEKMCAENEHVLSSCNLLPAVGLQQDMLTDVTGNLKRAQITLKIRYMSDVIRIKWGMNEKFAAVFSSVATTFNLKASEILLCINDKNINVDDTPSSLDLTMFDVIDCIPFRTEAREGVFECQDANRFLIKIQSNDSRKKVEMYMHKLEKMQDVMERYAAMRDIPLQDMVFEFDGEKILGTEIPEELEIESGSCIDVNILKTTKQTSSSVGASNIKAVHNSNRMTSSLCAVNTVEDESSSDSDIIVLS